MSKIIQYPKAGNSLRRIGASGAIMMITILTSACSCVNNVPPSGNAAASDVAKKI